MYFVEARKILDFSIFRKQQKHKKTHYVLCENSLHQQGNFEI